MTATGQLALLLDPLRDALTDAEVLTVEAKVRQDDRDRERDAKPAPPCRCGPRAWGDARRRDCLRCGRAVR